MGLMRRPVEYEELDLRISTVNILRLGGTILGTTNKGDPFAFPMPDGSLRDRSTEVIEGAKSLGLDALIGIGGDGSFAILRRLAQQGGLKLVGIPKTIDNDVGATESSIGYNTAVVGRDRGDRPAAADGGEPRPRHDPRGDGSRRRPHRAGCRNRRRRRHHPHPRNRLHHRGDRRPYRKGAPRTAAISRS